jgi:hypothetical protein
MTFIKFRRLFLLGFIVACNTSENVVEPDAARVPVEIILPEMPPETLTPRIRINCDLIDESSGLVKSRTQPNTFWTHNDSGDETRIFALDSLGESIQPANGTNYQGTRISNAINRDWEDITQDDLGQLIIGDCGNNNNDRRDLAFYIFIEPNPRATDRVTACQRIPFHYPDQTEFPPAKKNFDAEAIFWANGKIYLLTKHRSDTFTKLYRLDSQHASASNALTYLDRIDVGDQVTGADISPDGTELAVLTYSSVWLFEKSATSDDYFRGKISWLPISARQCEAICFSGDLLIIGNEQRELFILPPAWLVQLN